MSSFGLIIFVSTNTPDRKIVSESSHSGITLSMGIGLRAYYHELIFCKPEQGNALIWSSQCARSNPFMVTGQYSHFYHYHLIHCALFGVACLIEHADSVPGLSGVAGAPLRGKL